MGSHSVRERNRCLATRLTRDVTQVRVHVDQTRHHVGAAKLDELRFAARARSTQYVVNWTYRRDYAVTCPDTGVAEWLVALGVNDCAIGENDAHQPSECVTDRFHVRASTP